MTQKLRPRARKNLPPLLAAYREMVVTMGPEEGALTCMRGNPAARTMVIAPPITFEDRKNNLPMTSPEGLLVTGGFEDAGIREEAYIMISCQRHGTKMVADTYRAVEQFAVYCAVNGLVKQFVAIGSDAFKFIFGRGKKPSMETMMGAVMPIAALDYCKVMVMPDIYGLTYVPSDNRREDYARQMRSRELAANYERLLPKLKEFIDACPA